jgi:hypothetical protein
MEGDHEPAMFGVFETAAGMLLGRKNHQGFAAVWPPMAGDGAGPTASTQCQVGSVNHAIQSTGVECHLWNCLSHEASTPVSCCCDTAPGNRGNR